MTKQKSQLIFVAVCAIWNSARAQSYSVESFEGRATKIRITNHSTDRSRYGAKIATLTDSLFLTDYNGMNEVHVLNHKFLEIVYNTRGGTGSQLKSTLILSVKKNKINVALLADSYGEAFGGDIDGSLYKVKFTIKGSNTSEFKLVAHIYDKHRSTSSPQKNYVRNKNIILTFDPVRNIFYNTHKNIHQSFTINNPKTQKSMKQQIHGFLPSITLEPTCYYFIKDEWYKKGYDNNLFKEYYK